MSDALRLQPLILDLVEWSDRSQRTYGEVMDAWRTSCARLPVWETDVDEGYLRRAWREPLGAVIDVTEDGRALLRGHARDVAAG